MSARIDRVVTSGTFSLDGGTWDVDNNVWLIGDDSEVVVVDAAHDADAIAAAVGGRNVVAVLCTHGHNDHVTVAPELSKRLDAPILLHPGDEAAVADDPPRRRVSLARRYRANHGGGHRYRHPAHPRPLPRLGQPAPARTARAVHRRHPVQRGPGATGRSYSDFDTIIESIRTRLLTLPEDTTVHTGHGDGTTIGTEKPALADWIARGH